jgi:hypothetical protein
MLNGYGAAFLCRLWETGLHITKKDWNFTARNKPIMQKFVFCLFAFIQAVSVHAQKSEQGFDYAFKPTSYAPRYYVITEKRDNL